MQDSMLRHVLRQQPSIRELIENPTGAPPDGEQEKTPAAELLTALPQPGSEYEAHARMSATPVSTLYLVLACGSTKGFSNGELSTIDLEPSAQPGGGKVIVLRFAAIFPTEVRLTGRNIDALYPLIGDRRIGWVRELPPRRDFIDPSATAITAIAIMPVQPPA